MSNISGKEEYKNKYYNRAMTCINKNDPEGKYGLAGYYNYLIIQKSHTTAYVYLTIAVKMIKQSGVKTAKEINLNTYLGYLASLKDKSTANQIDAYHSLQAYSKYLKANGNTGEDYMSFVERPKPTETQESVQKRENAFLSKDEVQKLLAVVASEPREFIRVRDKAIIKMLLSTGIRVSALYKLDLDDIDFEHATIRVLEKGNKAREIHMTPDALNALIDWLEVRETTLSQRGNKITAVFISQQYKRMGQCNIYNKLKAYGERALGKNTSPHKFRATYGTTLYNATHDLYFVQQCMGHSNPKTTELYIRGQKENMSSKAAEIMQCMV